MALLVSLCVGSTGDAGIRRGELMNWKNVILAVLGHRQLYAFSLLTLNPGSQS